MIKPKDWLVQNGHMPEGYQTKRGRISLENKRLLEAAVLEGAQIEGFALQASTGPTEAPTVEKVKVTNEKEVPELAPFRYPEDEFQAWERRDGQKIQRSLREACGHCRYSLVGCWCPNPVIVAHDGSGWVHVTIERRR